MSKSVLAEAEVAAPLRAGRQELRTRETRELLMGAAKTIFIRDGYEGADLKDIAELAGRTKGAIYGHFKSKEDIFMALLTDHRREYRERLQSLFSVDVNQNLELMRKFLIELVEDDDWALLQLEFKLFTLRHPETKERYQNLYGHSGSYKEEEYTRLFGAAGNGEGSVSRTLAFRSIFPMLSALLLEAQFEPGLLDKPSIKKVIASVFDCVIEP